jgi:hypothetical protein
VKKLAVILLLGVVSLSCVFFSPTATPVPPPTLPAPLPTAAPMAATALAATPAAATPTAQPSPDFDPALYRPAMRPEFTADVNGFGAAPRYSITLTVNLDALQAAGREQVRYTNTGSAALSEIYFRLFPSAPGFGGTMTVTRVTVGGQTVPFQLEQRGTALKAPVMLATGASADLTLDFLIGIPRNPTVGYAMFGSMGDVTTLPDFYPVIPVRDETGWHIEIAPEYGDETFNPTALYDVSITAPATQVVITSGTCQPQQAGVWHCVSGPMRDFMLAMSANYKMVTQNVDDVTIHSYYLPRDATGGKRAAQVAADALRAYSRHFGPYPFAELDVVETGTRAGGIEYPGLVVIADSLYEQTDEGSYFDFVVAHEVAHQWWYSLVGNDQVNHPWMDESLVGYSTILYYEDVYGKAVADRVLRQVFEDAYQKLLQEKRDQRVDQPVSAFTQSDYSVVVYRKGPLFFKALREAIGDDKFDAFLKAYFRQNRYGIATPERMMAAAESVANRAVVRSLFDQWIESARTP